MEEAPIPIEGSAGFIQVLHQELEDPQYPFALQWRPDGSFRFQTAAPLEHVALARLGFRDKETFFRELHRSGFEQLTTELNVTSDTSRHQPIFRDPSGLFAPGSASRLDPTAFSNPVPATFEAPAPTSPPQIPLEFSQHPPPSARHFDAFSSGSGGHQERRRSPIVAVSSPMVRSPGLTNSSFSNSTRSFSPPFSPFLSPSPILVEPSSERWGTRPPRSIGLEGEEATTKDTMASAIIGLASLSIYESPKHSVASPSLPSDTYNGRDPIYVHPAHQIPWLDTQRQPDSPPDRDNRTLLMERLSYPWLFPDDSPPSEPPICDPTSTVLENPESTKRGSYRKTPRAKRHPRSMPTSSASSESTLAPLRHRVVSDPTATDHGRGVRTSTMSRSTPTYQPYPPPPPLARTAGFGQGSKTSKSCSRSIISRTRSFDRNPVPSPMTLPAFPASVTRACDSDSDENLFFLRDASVVSRTQRPTSFVRRVSSSSG